MHDLKLVFFSNYISAFYMYFNNLFSELANVIKLFKYSVVFTSFNQNIT